MFGIHFSWYKRLWLFEDAVKNKRIIVNSTTKTILDKLQKIKRTYLQFDKFVITKDNSCVYIRTTGLGLGTLFIRDCRPNHLQSRSKKTQRHKKVKAEDLEYTTETTREIFDNSGILEEDLGATEYRTNRNTYSKNPVISETNQIIYNEKINVGKVQKIERTITVENGEDEDDRF